MLDRILKLHWPVTVILSDETVTNQTVNDTWILRQSNGGDIVIIFELFSIVTTFFSYEENISTSSVFTILHGLLDKLEPNEDSGSDSKIINDFNYTVASQILHRFELQITVYSTPFLNLVTS